MLCGVVRVLKMYGAVDLFSVRNPPLFFSDMVDLVSYLFSKLNADMLSLSVVILHRILASKKQVYF